MPILHAWCWEADLAVGGATGTNGLRRSGSGLPLGRTSLLEGAMAPLQHDRGLWRAAWQRRCARASRDESGFSVVEMSVAMVLVFVVLTGTLATFSASIRNLSTGRQRTGAVALARAVVEEARAALYDQVGHDLTGDATLADDPAVTGTPKVFEGEDLIGVPSPVFNPHRRTTTNDSGSFETDVYVTWVTQGTADPFKRITVVVEWQGDTTNGQVSNEVRLSSYLFEAGIPPDPLIEGVADADGGTVTVTGSMSGVDLDRAVVNNPSAAGDVESLFVREATGQARATTGLLALTTGSVSGCDVSGTTAECAGVMADTSADSDASTALPWHDVEGPTAGAARQATAGGVITVALGANDAVESKGTARSCSACFASVIGDDDLLAYHWSEASGPDTSTIGFDVGDVQGDLVDMGGASQSTATVDQDPVADSQVVSTTAQLHMPAVDVVTIEGAPEGFLGAVQIGAADVTVAAAAGPTALAPTVTGDPIEVKVWDASGGTPGYRTITLTPGADETAEATASFDVGENTVSLTTAVVAGGESVISETDGEGTITYAEASLTNWLRITVALLVTGPSGTLVDTSVEFDYGRLTARAQWAPE